MPNEPSAVSTGISSLLSDYIPLLPSGSRRAGAARLMAERVGEDTSFLTEHPISSQLAALGLGGLLAYGTQGTDPWVRTGYGIAPSVFLSTARRSEINRIADAYHAARKRKRLRDIDVQALTGANGSSNLGVEAAYETMRHRRRNVLPLLNEALDPAVMAGSALGLGLPAAGIANYIDGQTARDMREKRAAKEKKDKDYSDETSGEIDQHADFSDQTNSPAIPLMALAALGGMAGTQLSGDKLMSELPKSVKLPTEEWGKLMRHTMGKSPLLFSVPGMQNASFAGYDNLAQAEGDARRMTLPIFQKRLAQYMFDNGVVQADPDFATPAVMAHEGGHGKIYHNKDKLMSILQRKAYPYANLMSPVAAAGSMAAGLAIKNPWLGALAGTGIGGLATIGKMGPEAQASLHGLNALKDFEGGKYMDQNNKTQLLAALGTYAGTNILPSTLAGAFGGWVSRRRQRKALERKMAGGAA